MSSIEALGPAYVKVAQAMSTRVDLLTPAYLLAIQRLQVGEVGEVGVRGLLFVCGCGRRQRTSWSSASMQ